MILHRSDMIYVHELSWKKGGGDNSNSIITCAAKCVLLCLLLRPEEASLQLGHC